MFRWYGRGENASASRRTELRRVAHAEANKRLAIAEAAIKKASVEMQTRIVAAGLTSDTPRALLEAMPSPTDLMPESDFQAIERIAAPEHPDDDE
jgi:hypothetical protein